MRSQPDAAPLHLTSADFDAHLPERATSADAAVARRALKGRMLEWGRGVVLRLAELGVAVEVAADDAFAARNGHRAEHQRVSFSRDPAARDELARRMRKKRAAPVGRALEALPSRHVFLELRLDTTGVEVSVTVPSDATVDARNLRARLTDPARTLELTSALEALPIQFTIGLAREPQRTPAAEATSERIREVVARAEQEKDAVWIGWTVPRELVVTHTALLDEQLEDAIVALGPIHKLIAWAPDNDWIRLGSEVPAVKDVRSRTHDAPRDRAATQARRDRVEHDQRKRALELSREATDEPGKPDPAEAPAPLRRVEPIRAVPRVLARRSLVTEVDPRVPIERGTRVQVLAGPFRGKVGVVQELDGKGAARVILGLLATRLETSELIAAAEGRERPALSSSHRKPIGVRS